MKTRILPKSVYVLTAQEERDYDTGGYDRETIVDSLNRRFGESEGQATLNVAPPANEFTEVHRRDGRVIGRFKGKG
jgi:hypothetical protein